MKPIRTLASATLLIALCLWAMSQWKPDSISLPQLEGNGDVQVGAANRNDIAASR